MYRREFLEAAGATTAAVPLAGEPGTEPEAEATKTAGLSLTVDDGALYLCGYPLDDDEMAEGDVVLSTGPEKVHLGVSATDDDDRAAGAMLSFDPDTADEVGDMLHEFAEKARNGEGWEYP